MRLRPMFSRRIVLMVLLGAVLWIWARPGSSHAQQVMRPMTNQEAASHALNRLAFGPRPGQVQEVIRLGWKNWAEQQLHPESINDLETERLIAEKCPSLALSLSELQALERLEEDQRPKIKKELADSVLLRAVYSNRQFQEVILEFWRNHFNVDVNKVPFLATHYEQHVLRKHAFGKFEDLLMSTAKHPAMLVYLDNYVSRANGLNENYARELMELHTLGVDNGYTQQDVIELARVLTGWTCGQQRTSTGEVEYGYIFDEGKHDSFKATVVGLELDGRGGMVDGERAVRHLARHVGTAIFISTKLCRYLVSDAPSPELVDKVANVFCETEGDLSAVYRAILFSPEFMNARNFRAKFKTPLEFVVSVLRTTDARLSSTEQLHRELELMGQPIYEHFEPTGYSDLREAWLDPGVMIYRWNFAIQLVQGKVPGMQVGEAFSKEVLTSSQAKSAKQVLAVILPGVNDPATERLVSEATDIRAMVALALGSPGYQQQ